MRIVALTELRGELDAEAGPLAAILGLSAYDVRARVLGGVPCILLQTVDRELAQRAYAGVTARGHGAVECDASLAVPSAQMVKLHRFSLDPSGLRANGAGSPFLGWGDLGAIVVVVLRGAVARTTEEGEYPTDVRRSPKKVKHEITKTEHTVTHVAYLFPGPRSAERRPWLLEEASAQFLSLGPRMQPTRRANFDATVAALREHAPLAAFDDRFVAHPQTSSVLLQVRGGDSAPPVVAGSNVDLLVRLLADWLMRDRSGPYRG